MSAPRPFGDGVLNVAMVGAGFVAPIHAAGWQALEDVALSAISSRTRAKTAAVARDFDIPAVYDTVPEMLDAAKPNVLDICAATDTHLDFITMAAERGTDVICQKPIAEDIRTAQRIAAVAANAGIRLMVHENFRFRPWYREIRRQLDSGVIGRPFYCRSDGRMPGTVTTHDHPETPWSLQRQPFFAGLGRFLILESVIHQIDVCRYLFGDIHRVYARSRRISPHVTGEDVASIMLDFDGLHAIVERSYASRGQPAPPLITEIMVIEGENGALFLERDGRIRIEVDTPDQRETLRPDMDLTDAYPRSYAAAIRHFVDCYRQGLPFETDITDNLKTLAVTLAAYDSVNTGDAVRLTE